jgi:hypothetical protein
MKNIFDANRCRVRGFELHWELDTSRDILSNNWFNIVPDFAYTTALDTAEVSE